jgi:hypothetical protein
MGLAKAVEAASDVVYGVLQQGERMDLIAGSLFLRGVAGVAGLAAGMATTGASPSACWTWRRMDGGLVFYDLPRASDPGGARGRGGCARAGRPGPCPPRLAGPPAGHRDHADVADGEHPVDLRREDPRRGELGIYTALAYSYAASHRIASAMGEAASARLARHHAEGRKRAFTRVCAGCSPRRAGGAAGRGGRVRRRPAAPDAALRAVYGERADLLLGFMLVASISDLGIVLDYTMTAMRRLRIQPFIYGAAIADLCRALRPLIPAMGLAGAILALGIVSLLQGAVTSVVVARSLRRFRRRGTRPSIPAKAEAA